MSKIYSISIYDTGFFTNTYGGLGLNSKEDGYLLSKKEQQELWKKWIKKAIDLGHIEAIDTYASSLNQSHMFKYISPEDSDETFRSTIKSLYYYKKLFQLTGNTGRYDRVLSSILDKIHDFALDSKKLNELKKELKKSIE